MGLKDIRKGNRGGGWGGGGRGGWGKGGGGGGWGRSGGGRGRGGGGGGWGSRDRGADRWRGHHHHHHHRQKEQKLPEGVDPTNSVIRMFQGHSRELDRKHDKHERIVKLSRDITVESKRVIFLLHRILREDDKPAILGEAEHKLGFIRSRFWFSVAKELQGEDPYQFLRAFTSGLQEYIEAYSFYYYILYGRLVSWEEMQRELTFWVYEGRKKKEEVGEKPKQRSTSPNRSSQEGSSEQDISEVLRAAEEEAACGENKGKEEEEGEKAEEQEGKKADKESKKFSAAAKDDDKEEEEEEKSLLTSASTEPETPKKGGEQEKEKEGKERGGGGGGEDSGAAGAADSSTKRGVDGAPAATRGEDRREIRVEVPKDDFVLGLADLTGEVMRQAINMVGAGETDVCFQLLRFLHEIGQGFDLIRVVSTHPHKELRMKTKVLQQSLRKVENACYTIEVRGSEIPKSHLAGVFRSAPTADFDADVDVASTFSD